MERDRVTFLIVDDDEVSVMAVRRALQRLQVENPVAVARDGVEALEVMENLPRPYIILLDINMPRMNGHEFLAAIRDNPDHRTHVVFVLTTSDAPQDIMHAYERQIAGYIVKENAFRSIGAAVKMLDDYIETVRLPAA